MEPIKYDSINNEFYYLTDSHTREDTVLPQIIWHITDKCFLNCPYCFASKTEIETNLDNLDETITLFKILGVQKVDIAGGDPLTFDKLDVICNKLYSEGIAQTITTSGIGRKNVKQWLIENGHMFSRIIVSIDGSTPEDHNRLRGKGVYENLFLLIKAIKEKNYNNLRINTVVTSHFDDISNCKKIVELISSLEPVEWCLIQTHPANKKEEYEKFAVSNIKYQNVLKEIKLHSNCIFKKKIQITERHASNYSDYWVLYPNNHLSKHSEGANDLFNIEFISNNLEIITKNVSDSGVWIPMNDKK